MNWHHIFSHLEIYRRHSTAIIGYLNELAATRVQHHVYDGGAGVQAVLHQLLDGSSKVKDTLPGTP